MGMHLKLHGSHTSVVVLIERSNRAIANCQVPDLVAGAAKEFMVSATSDGFAHFPTKIPTSGRYLPKPS